MKDTEKERQRERERAWNKPLAARPRTVSHTDPTSHSPRLGSDQPRSSPNGAARSREHSQPSSPNGSVRSRAAEEGDGNYKRERNWGSPQSKWEHQRRHQASPIPGTSLLRARTDSTHSNDSDTHAHKQAQNGRLRHHPSQSSLHSEDSSRPASPADHRRSTEHKDEEEGAIHERERNWGSRHQKWTHNHVHRRSTSPNPAMSHSRVRTQSLESDSSAPAMSILTRSRSPLGLPKGRPSELSLPPQTENLTSRHTPPPPEVPEDIEHDEASRYPTSASPRLRPVNGRAYDNPVHLSSRLPRPDSPIVRSSGVNGNGADGKGSPASAPARFGWQFPRNRPQLPDFERESSSTERSPSPVHRPTSHLVGSGKPSHIPVRSPGQVPKVEIKRNGAVQSFKKGHKRATTEFTEANGAVPPKVQFQPEPDPDPEFASGLGRTDGKSSPGWLSFDIYRAPFSHISYFKGATKVYRTRRHLWRGQSRFHQSRRFIHFLLSIIHRRTLKGSQMPPLPTIMIQRFPLRMLLPLTLRPPLSSPLLLVLVRPSALPESSLKHPHPLKASPSFLVHLHPKMTRGISPLCP